MYEITTRSAQILDKNGREQTISINGSEFMMKMPYADSWTDFSFGIHRLKKGTNKIQLLPKYGYGAYDTITVKKADLPALNVSPTLSDSKATSETQGLMNYLCDVYGKHMLSGQQEIYGGGHTESSPNGYSGADLQGYETEFEYIKKNFGDYPAIRGFDYMNYNPLYGWDDQTTERIIEWGTERNGIPTVCWHINVPKDFANYELGDEVGWQDCTYKPTDTDFNTANAIVEGTKEYEYVMLTIKTLAAELKKVQDAGVPIIFRPYHEAEGNTNTDGSGSWFWWGKSGSAVYKDLWKLTYKTLTEDYGLHNIIWEWNSYTFDTSTNWYPGDEYVDLVAYDKYNCTDWSTGSAVLVHNDSAIGGTFYSLVEQYGGKKMVAMAENDSIPTLENLQMEKAGWLYFCPWYDGGSNDTNFLSNEMFNKKEDLKEIYTSDYCITLDELPENLYSNSGAIITTTSGTGQTTTSTTTTTTTTMTTTKIDGATMADIENNDGVVNIIFDRSMGKEIHLIVNLDDSLGYANGCVGVSVKVDGVDYWVSYKWEASKSDDITVSLGADNVYNITYNNGSDKVEDEALIAKIAEAAQKEKQAQFQVWWANDAAGKKADTAKAKLVAAYLKDKSGETTTTETAVTTTDAGTTTTPEETTTEATESTTTASAEGTTTAPSETTTTVTTAATTGGESEAMYGDVNMDGKVDLTDAIILNKYQAGLVTFTDAQKANANCDITDGTENITEDDTVALMRFVLMMEGYENLPYNDAK